MTDFKNVPDEMLGLFILVCGVIIKLSFPAVEDFWLALVTAVTLFLLMHVRSRVILKASP